MSRYQRHIQLAEVGKDGQDKLGQARVLVVGAGGLGCPALQYLTAAGIGQIGIVDGDRVSLNNLQRQVLFTEQDIGKNKALVAKESLSALNSEIEIRAYTQHLTLENAESLISGFDLILDCSDNFVTRYLINDVCIRLDKPFVHGSLFKFEGQVSVFNFQNGPSYRCLFPDPPKPGDVPNCNEVGVLGVLPGVIGTLQATEAIKIILGLGQVLSGKLLLQNLLSHKQRLIEFSRNEGEIRRIKGLTEIELVATDDCIINSEISLDELDELTDFILVDVRESDEYPRISKEGLFEIPMSELENRMSELPVNPTKVFFCASGIRSARAVSIVTKHGIPNCLSLQEGAEEMDNYELNER